MRLAITRAVSGLSGLAIQSASTRRRPEVLAPAGGRGSVTSRAGRTDGKPGSTFSPLAWGLPRRRTNVSRGAGPVSVTHSASARAEG
jgi:hypothetical protein